jgi:hypothetical protein
LYEQHKSKQFKEFDTFDAAVDQFFSEIESQKIDMKARSQVCVIDMVAIHQDISRQVSNLFPIGRECSQKTGSCKAGANQSNPRIGKLADVKCS